MHTTSFYYQKAVLLLLLLSLSLLVVPVRAQNNVRIHSSTNGSTSKMQMETDGESITIEHDGEVIIGADDRTVTGITDGGFFRVKKTTFGNTRELLIKNTGNTLSHEYKEGGRSVAFDPAGKAWLADILPELVRSTTIGAASRVDRFYRKGGAKAVLAQVGNLKGDHAKARYAELLLKKDIAPAEVPAVIDAIGLHVGSDFYRYEIFRSNADLLLANSQHLGNFLKAVQSVNSDHYKSELVKLAFSRELPDAYTQQALQLIGTINSDHYRSEILQKMVKNNSLNDRQLEFVLGQLLPELHSDHYRTQIISSIIKEQQTLSSNNIAQVITSIGQISSDHYATEVLKLLLKTQTLNDQNLGALFQSLDRLQSDHYKAEFMRLLTQQKSFAKQLPLFLQESQNMSSDHYRSEVLRTALAGGALDDAQKASLARSTSSMRSDHYKTEVLMSICKGGAAEKAKAAIQEVAKTINSTHYYGTVMKCVQ